MTHPSKRGHQGNEAVARPTKLPKAIHSLSDRRTTRAMSAEIRNKQIQAINKKFFGVSDVQVIIMEMLPARDVLKLSTVSRELRDTVATTTKLQKKLFLVADTNYEPAVMEDFGKPRASKSRLIKAKRQGFRDIKRSMIYDHPSPHLNHLIFDLDHTNYDEIQMIASRDFEWGQSLGESLDSLFPVTAAAFRGFDRSRTPAHFHTTPFRLYLTFVVHFTQHTTSVANGWSQDSSCATMFLTQPPVEEVSISIVGLAPPLNIPTNSPISTQHVTIRNEEGVMWGAVWKEVERFSAKAEAYVKERFAKQK